jgi:hypothetical protein
MEAERETAVVILINPNDCQNYFMPVRRLYKDFIPTGLKDCYHTIIPDMRKVERSEFIAFLQIDTAKTQITFSDRLFESQLQAIEATVPTSHIAKLNKGGAVILRKRFKDLSRTEDFQAFVLAQCP